MSNKLLTKQEELDLSKSIERYSLTIISLLLDTLYGTNILLNWVLKIKVSKKKIKEVIKRDFESFDYKELFDDTYLSLSYLQHFYLSGKQHSIRAVQAIILDNFSLIELNDKGIGFLTKHISKKHTQMKNSINKHLLKSTKESRLRVVYCSDSIDFNTLDTLYNQILENRNAITRARNIFVTRNLRLVIDIAKRYQGRGSELADLIQEGTMGLMKAADKFDYRRDLRFSTSATWWIRQMITSHIYNHSRLIRLPAHTQDEINRIDKARASLDSINNTDTTYGELSEIYHKEIDYIQNIDIVSKDTLSIDYLYREDCDQDSGASLRECIRDDSCNDDEIVNKLLISKIKDKLYLLTPREEKVIRLRFGLVEEADFLYGVKQQIEFLSSN